MNSLSHFLNGGIVSKMFTSPVLMSSSQILQKSLANNQTSWLASIFSSSFFNKKSKQDTSKNNYLTKSQLLPFQQSNINLMNNSSNQHLKNPLFDELSSVNAITSLNSQGMNNMWSSKNLLKIASRNNSTIKNFMRVSNSGNSTSNNAFSNLINNNVNINNSKLLQQKLQYNVISTKEFHHQKKNLSKIKAFVKEFVLLLKEGTKDTYADGKWFFNLLAKKSRNQMTGYEVRQSLRIRSDLFKIIPFSFFVIVPAGELLLPVYLYLFPNAMPSQYTFDYTYDQYIQSLEDNQAAAHEHLVQNLKTHLMEKSNATVDHFRHSDSYKQIFFKNFKNFENDDSLNFNKFNSDNLITVGRFLGMEMITGTNIISKILNIIINTPIWFSNLALSLFKKEKLAYSKFSLSLNFGPFEMLKRQLLLFQIKRHLSLLRLQDQAFFKMGFHDIVGHRITDFARERGITTITCYETLKTIMANEWVNVCINRKFNDNAMLWYAIMQYDLLRNTNNDMN